jgi:hypothetical protein
MTGVIENRISDLADKLREVEVKISSERGDFALFALIERDDSIGKWDIVVAAKWIKHKKKGAIETIASQIKTKLTEDEQLALSRIVVLQPDDPFVKSLSMVGVMHGNVKLSNNNFNGIFVREAYLITSKS